jgi:hypothetical protein
MPNVSETVVVEVNVEELEASGKVELTVAESRDPASFTSFPNKNLTTAVVSPCSSLAPHGLFTTRAPIFNASNTFVPATRAVSALNTNPATNLALISGRQGVAAVFTGSAASSYLQWPTPCLYVMLIVFQLIAGRLS